MATSRCGLPNVPLRGKLSAKYKESFAYPTIKDRCPIILCKIIDHLYRERIHIGQQYGPEAQDGLKVVIEELSRLRYEMQTNKNLTELNDDLENCQVWNDYLKEQETNGEGVSWFSGTWMWVECYMYRRVLHAMTKIEKLRSFDFFWKQKQEGFQESRSSMEMLAGWLLHTLTETETCVPDEETFSALLQISLWGNKCDLSISAGSKAAASGNTIEQLNSLSSKILVNQCQDVWKLIQDSNQIIDIVMDNAGYELFTDLCLADFLISCKKAKQVRFRVKDQPWFVSDTTQGDFEWTINQLFDDNFPSMSKLGERWKEYLRTGLWTLHIDSFWTYPHVYSELQSTDPQLYCTLGQAKLVIFKGDLNYRKLVGDINWETTTSFKHSLKGFLPTNILALRTLKADVVTGLKDGEAERLNEIDKDWMINGSWGVIQLCNV